MIQQNKKGFSLVEVMFLFTILAVVLTAAIPIISRKSAPVPNKVNHGVYRCIHTQNGMLEELYTGSRKVRSVPGVDRCSFAVPKAGLYRVDLYSAGAGGTKGALINAALDDFRLAVFKSNGEYENGEENDSEAGYYTNSSFNRKTNDYTGKGMDNLLVQELTAQEIIDLFKGENLIKSVYSRDAGSGGDAHLRNYDAPVKYYCGQYLSAKSASANEKAAAERVYTPIKAVYDDYTRQRNEAETAYNNAQANVNFYNDRKTKLANLVTELDKAVGDRDYTSIVYACNAVVGTGLSCSTSDLAQALLAGMGQSSATDAEYTAELRKGAHLALIKTSAMKNNAVAQQTANESSLASAVSTSDSAYNTYTAKNTQLTEYTPTYTTAKDKYETARNIDTNISSSQIESALASRLAGKVNDKPLGGGINEQLKDYCATRYANNTSADQTVYTDYETRTRKRGGEGGKGAYIRVTFPFTFHAILGESLDNIKNYLHNLQTPGHAEAFYPTYCEGFSGNKGTNCVLNDPGIEKLDGKKQENIVYENKKRDVGAEGSDHTFTYANPLRTVNTTDGKDLKKTAKSTNPYPAWNLPYHNGGVAIRKNEDFTMISNAPTLGTRGIWQVNETPSVTGTYTSTTASLKERIKRGEVVSNEEIANAIFGPASAPRLYDVYKINEQDGIAGTNAAFHSDVIYPLYDDLPGVNAKIDNLVPASSSSAKPVEKDIKVKIESSLWSKTYQIGMGGSAGKYKSIITPNLGSNCEFTVPAGGRVINWPEDADNAALIERLERNLALEMTCYNKDGTKAFQKRIDGGKYDPRVKVLDSNPNNKFYWSKDVQKFEYGTDEKEQPGQWYPTSIWARAFHFMGGFNAYDLNAYGISKGGKGTTVVDRCVAPKGYYDTYKVYLKKYGNTNDLDSMPVYKENQAKTDPVYFPGETGGEDCYGYPAEDQTATQFIVSEGEENHHDYIDVSAEDGGGGAVVITW